MLRQYFRRRLMTFASLAIFVFLCATLHLKKHLSNIGDHNTKHSDTDQVMEYTLPSLDDVINSMVDLDFQRALLSFKNQYSQISNESIQHKRIIIASTWRSGSTFLAEILASHPGIFYHYEPLLQYNLQQFGPGNKQQKEIVNHLKDLLHCNYDNMEEYLKFNYANKDSFLRNKRLWNICSSMPRFKCYQPDILNKLCSLFPIHLMKLVRARISLIEPFLSDSSTKIIFLTRDPRAVMSSRTSNVFWCSEKICSDPRELCSNMEKDINSYIELKRLYPNQIMILRYEDLIQKIINKTSRVLNFVGLNMRLEIVNYLNNHTSSDSNIPWSTYRDPQKQLSKWMKTTPWNKVTNTQYFCRYVMKSLGYRIFESESDFSSGNSVQILNL